MATLSTTLSKAPAKTPTYTTSTGVQKQNNPYSRLGAQPSSALSGAGSLYAALSQQNQMQRPVPSTEFQANYNFDPVLSKLTALQEMSIANARSEAAAAKKQALIGAGSEGIARDVGADENTINAAKGNTLSTQALLQRDFGDRQRQLDEALNSQNLFYSGERIKQMGDLEFGRAKAESDFGGKLRELLSHIDNQLRSAEEAEQLRQIEAQIAAAGTTFPGVGGGASGAGGSEVPVIEEPPPVDPLADPTAGSFANWEPSAPVGMESPNAIYIPGIGFRTAPDPYEEALAALLQGQYQRPVSV